METISEAWEGVRRFVAGIWRAVCQAWQVTRRRYAWVGTWLLWRLGPARMLAPVQYRQTGRGRVPVLDPLTRDMQRVMRARGGRR